MSKKKWHYNIPASYLILIESNKILLLRRFNTGYEDGKYSFIAGHVEPGETFTSCIIREAKEEANIKILPEDLHVSHVMQRNSKSSQYNEKIDVFFIATKWIGQPINNEPHKCDDLSWFKINDIPENTIPYIKSAIQNIQHKIFYSEFG